MVWINSIIRLLIVQGVLMVVQAGTPKSVGTSWYYDNWCGDGHEYLDDGKCVKIFPTTLNRDWSCPIVSSTVPEGYQPDSILADASVDTAELNPVVNDSDVNLCIILTKRVADASAAGDVRLYNKYLCAGDYSATVPYETWSSSKVFAMANAAGHLRSNESCTHDPTFGMDGSVSGKHGITQLGDLATVICSYDETAGYSSNSLSSYFHDIGWRGRANNLVQDWLLVGEETSATAHSERNKANKPVKGQDDDLSQSLGGNYGEATPSDLTFTVTSPTAASCAADKDPWPVKYPNSLAALSAAELVRRLAQHRELQPALRFPGAEWKDIQTILYGAVNSTLFPGQVWGGMSADIAIYTQAGLDLGTLLSAWDPQDHSQWRIFSKLGAGWSTDRLRGEIVSNAYSCLPKYDGEGSVVGGIEFTIAARGSVPGDSSLNAVEQKLHTAMDKALHYVLAHYA